MKFEVEVRWTMWSSMVVDADSREEAEDKAYAAPLPDGEYLSDSFAVDVVREVK